MIYGLRVLRESHKLMQFTRQWILTPPFWLLQWTIILSANACHWNVTGICINIKFFQQIVRFNMILLKILTNLFVRFVFLTIGIANINDHLELVSCSLNKFTHVLQRVWVYLNYKMSYPRRCHEWIKSVSVQHSFLY